MVTETICLQCGSRGFENAFVYCIRCLKFAVHRYCLDKIPETLDEFVSWLCDDCELIMQKQITVFEHGAIQCQASHHKVSKSIESFSRNGMEKSDMAIVEYKHVCEDASEQACDGCAEIDSVECGELAIHHSPVELDCKTDENPISAISQQSQQLEDEKVEANLMGSIELSSRCLTGSTIEKDQLRLAIKSYDECVEVDLSECTKMTCDSAIPSLVKENGCSEQKEEKKKKIKNKKRHSIQRGENGRFESKRRGKNIAESNTEKAQLSLATSNDECAEVDNKECTRPASNSTLHSKVKENDLSEQKDQEEKKIENEKKMTREKNTTESNTEKVQDILAPSYNECVKVDNKECTGSVSDSTLLSKVKENGCSDQKEQEEKKIKNNKRRRKRKRNIMGSTTEEAQHRASDNEHVKADTSKCTRLGSDSALPSNVKEDGRSYQKDQEEKKIENEKKMKREKNTTESNTEKVQDILATSYNECVKGDSKECTGSASDSTLLSKVKENVCSDQKEQEEMNIENKKRRRKRKKNIMGSTTEKAQHRASHDEHVKADTSECTRLGSDSALPSNVKENGRSYQKDQEEKKIENKKRQGKRKRNVTGSSTEKDQHRANHDEHVKADISECTRVGSDSALPSEVKENGCSEQKAQEQKKIKNRSAMERKKRKRTRNIMRCTTEKDQLTLATTSPDEHVKADISGCTSLGSGSTLPSNVKEKEGCEQKDQTCIPKPFDSASDLGVAGAHAADHPVISSDGPSKSLRNERNITSTKTISQKQVHQPGVAKVSNREKDLGSSSDYVENRGPEDEKEQTSTSYLMDLDYSVARPIATPIWRGSFSIPDPKYGSIDELMAHISNKACQKVYETASQFQPVLRLEILPKYDIWPKSFQTSEPNGDNIALYFFPSKICNQVFEQLVEEMINNELSLKGVMQNAELLIFTSTELPVRYWRFQNRYYLWGVFRGKQASSSNPLSRVGEVAQSTR